MAGIDARVVVVARTTDVVADETPELVDVVLVGMLAAVVVLAAAAVLLVATPGSSRAGCWLSPTAPSPEVQGTRQR